MVENEWEGVLSSDMTEAQAKEAVRQLRKALMDARAEARIEIKEGCKYRLPCGMCEKFDSLCTQEANSYV